MAFFQAENWIARRIDAAQRLMPMFDDLPKSIREMLASADVSSWELIRTLHHMKMSGRSEKQLARYARTSLTKKSNAVVAKGLVIKRQTITLADLEL